MEKPYFSCFGIRHFLVGCLFVLGLFIGSFSAFGQAPAPTGLSVANLTQTAAVVSWECEASSSRDEGDLLCYDYVVSTNQLSTTLTNSEFSAMTEGSNGVSLVGRAVEMATNQLPIDGLSTGTMYYMLIRQNAEDVFDGTSSWVALSFNTLCEGTELPIALQTFDGASMPACWVGAGGNIPVLQSDYKYGYAGNALKLESTSENYSYLFSPVILGSSSTSELAFKVYATGPSRQRFSVGVAYANDIMSYMPVMQDSIIPGEWYDISVVDPNGFCEDNYVWVIYAEAGIPSVIYVDNVEVHDKPACVRPYGLTVTDVTATSATFAWTSQGAETAWNLELTADGSENPIIVPATENPFVYEGLNENTSYSVRVQADCGSTAGLSEWSLDVEFTTLQIPQPIPFLCDFEDNISWSFVNGDAINAWCIGSAVNNGGSKALYISDDGGYSHAYDKYSSSVAWVYKQVEITEEADYNVRFDWKALGESGSDYMAAVLVPASVQIEPNSDNGLRISSSIIVPDGWVLLGGSRLEGSEPWRKFNVEQHLTPGIYKFAFFWRNDGSGGNNPPAAIDNISITKVVCPTPSSISLKALKETAVALTFPEGNYNVKVYLGETADPEMDGDAIFVREGVNGTECLVTGLSANTTYVAFIQALCEEGASGWSAPVKFTTLCSPLTSDDLPFFDGMEAYDYSFPECWTLVYSNYENYPYAAALAYNPAYEGEKSLYSSYYTGGVDEDPEAFNAMIALPGLSEDMDVSALSLNFYMKGSGAKIVVGVMTDPADKETFVEVGNVVGTSNYKECFVHFTSYVGEGKFIAIKYDGVLSNVNIDNVRIMPTPTCFKPHAFTINDITDTEALIKVIDQDHLNAVDVEYGMSGFTLGEGMSVQIQSGDSAVTLTGLVPQTSYDVYVRNNCGEGDVSEWLPKQSFKTLCTPDLVNETISFMEDFESYSTDDVDKALGNCWMQSSGYNKWILSSGNEEVSPCRGTKGITLTYDSDSWIYRNVHLEPGNYQLSCYAVLDSEEGCTLSLGFGDTFEHIEKIYSQEITNGPCQLVRSEFAVDAEGDYVIGIHGLLTWDPFYVLVDDISLKVVNCLAPEIPIVTEITDVSAKASWTETGALSYNIKVFTSEPDVIETATPVYAATDIHPIEGALYANITGLSELTTYYVYVQGMCDDGSLSEWSHSARFTTQCSTFLLSESTPYVDGFESDSHVECWTTILQEGGNVSQSDYTAYNGTTALCAYLASIVSPQFGFVEGENLSDYQLSGFVYALSDELNFSVGIMKNTDREGYQNLTDVTVDQRGVWKEFIINFASLADVLPDLAEYKYIELNFTEEDEIYLDDLRLEVIPTCPKPKDISFSAIDDKSAVVDWQSGGTESQWRMTVTPEDATEPVINEIIEEKPYTLSGLQRNTSYVVRLTAICSASDESQTYSKTFVTTCGQFALPLEEDFNNISSGIPNCWDNSEGTATSASYKWTYYADGYDGSCVRFDSYYNPDGKTSVLKSPAVILDMDSRLRFVYKNPSDLYDTGAELDVILCTADGTTVLDTIARDLQSSAWKDTTINLSTYTGQTVIVKFMGTAHSYYDYMYYEYYGNYLYLDNVVIEAIPSCEKPQKVKVSKKVTSANIEIIDEFNNAWEYAYGAPGFDVASATPVAMSSTTAVIEGLEAATAYEIYVRGVCSADDKSLWVGPFSFTTLPLPVSIPYTCDFEGNDIWNMINGSAVNAWYIGAATHNGGSKALYVSNDGGLSNKYTTSSATSNVWATKSFEVTEEGDYIFRFDWKASGESEWDYMAAVVVPDGMELTEGSDNGLDLGSTPEIPEGWFSLTGTSRLNQSGTWQECTSELHLIPGIYHLAFFWKNDGGTGSNPPAAVDNVSIVKLACSMPGTPVFSSITATDVQMTFASVGEYNVKVFEFAQNNPETATGAVFEQEGITDQTCLITGLNASTQYYVYIQKVCGEDGVSEWSEASSFYTACEVETLPFEENFDSWNDISPCWTNVHTMGSSADVWTVSTAKAYSGKAAYVDYQMSGNKVVLSTPALMAEAGKRYRLTFYMYHHDSQSYVNECLNVYRSTSALPNETSSLLGKLYTYVVGNPGLGTSAGIYKHELQWTQTNAEEIYVIFEIEWENGFGIAIDEIVIEEVPTCERPEYVRIGKVTNSTVDVTLTDPLGSKWEAVIGPKGFNPNAENITVFPMESTVATLTGVFEPEVEMELYVRTDCGEEDGKSRWYGPVSFEFVDWSLVADGEIGMESRGMYPWDIFDDAGTAKAQSTNGGIDNSISDLTASFMLQTGERATLNFDYYVSSEESTYDLADYLMMFVDPDDYFTDDDYDTSFGKKGGVAGESGSYSIHFDEPGMHTVIWRYYKNLSASDGDDMAKIWNIALQINNFFEPENLKVESISETDATLSWVSSLAATGHQVRLMNVGVDTVYVDNINTNTVELHNLIPNTEYVVTVRSSKGNNVGDTTIWSTPFVFRTPMEPLTSASLPYRQNWENTDENDNWALIGGSSSINRWVISGEDAAAVTGNAGTSLYITNNGTDNLYSVDIPTTVYAYRSFVLDPGAYSLSFDWKAVGEYGLDYLRAFLVPADIVLKNGEYEGEGSSVPSRWIEISETLYGSAEWQSEMQTIILEDGGYYNLVFMWTNDRSDGNQAPAAVDNIELASINCLGVSNLQVITRTKDMIEVAWESPLTDNFEAVCVLKGTDISTVDESAFQTVSVDTIRFEGLQEYGQYDIYVRSVCAEGEYSSWSTLNNVIVYEEFATLPYSCDFETGESYAWSLWNGDNTNQWVVGSAIQNGGANALYISSDNGTTHSYDVTAKTYSYASRKFIVEEENLYTITFDWMAKGEVDAYGDSYYDFMNVFLLTEGDEIQIEEEAQSSWSSLTGELADNSSWITYSSEETLLTPGTYQLVFYWENDVSDGVQPPAAIDNISITGLSCMYPTNLSVDNVTDHSVDLSWSGNVEKNYEVRVDESEDVAVMESPFISVIQKGTSIVLDDLEPSTRYNVAVRAICAEGDSSRWSYASFLTDCLPLGLPYRETFDVAPACWNKYSGMFSQMVNTNSLSVSSSWNYTVDPMGNMDEHMYSNIYGSGCNNWLVSPALLVSDVEQMVLYFDIALSPYNSSAILEPGAQADDKFIVSVSTDNGRTWNRSNGRIWDNIGSEYVYDHISPDGETISMALSEFAENGDTIRIAFYGESTVDGGDNNLHIDNLAISTVETIELSDSICTGTSYSDNGFTIQPDELTPGMHHQFNRLEMAVAEGASDKMYVLDLYVYPDGNVVVYDTVCAGTPYNEYGFSIENPLTRTYYSPSGLYTVNGCDSMVTLHLFVPETQFNERVTICEGDSYEFAGQELTESGTYTHTFAGMYCDSTVTLELVVLPSETEESMTICHGDSILFDNVWRKASGDYTATFKNILDCDSTVTLHLTVRDEIRYAYSGVLCSGGVYNDDNFSNLTEAREYTKTLESASGCDSIVVLTLTVKEIAPSSFNEEICEGDVYTFGGVEYNTTGDYSHRFESVDGCDSVVTLHLTVLPVSESEQTLEITTDQLPYEIKHNGEVVHVVEEGTEPGTTWPEIVIENGAANGCDSIINLTLTVKLGDALHLTDYEELQFWPNPIDRGGKVLISADFSPAERTNLKIEVYNSIGQCVATHRPTGESLYVEDFHVSGMYLVKVTTGTGKLYVGHVIVK